MVVRAVDQLITAEQFAEMPESRHAELVRGRIVEVPLSNWTHGAMVARLCTLLTSFVMLRKLGGVFGGDPGMMTERNPDTVRGPDIAFVRMDRLASIPRRGFWSQAPDLVVEVLSPSNTRDMDTKVDEYLRAGVRLIWLIDPEQMTVVEYRTVPLPRTLGIRDVLEGHDVLDGFHYPVADIFDADKPPMYPAGE